MAWVSAFDKDKKKKGGGGGGGTGPFGLVDWPGDGGGGGGKDKDKKKGGGRDKPGDGKGPGRMGDNDKIDGLYNELRQNIENVMRQARQQDKVLMEGYETRVGGLRNAKEDNEKSANAQSFANLSNRGRERANALSEVMAQGGGETDLLRAQGASLRNWSSNQQEGNRSFFDTLTSVNSSLADLNTDTKSARVQVQQQMLSDKQQLWNGYFDAKSEALTQLGNTYGQMAEYYGLADEQVGSKKRKRKQQKASDLSGQAFMDAAKVGSESWKMPGIDDDIKNWEGEAAFEGSMNNSRLTSIGPGQKMARPEGATLRKWNA